MMIVLTRLTNRIQIEAFDHFDSIRESEAKRVHELFHSGALVELWRVAGTRTNLAIWNVDSAESLDLLLKSLPAYPWLEVEVSWLSAHPSRPQHGGHQ